MLILAQEFPPLGHLVDWPGLAGTEGAWYEINKIVLVYALSAIITIVLFAVANRRQLVPNGIQNLMEMAVEFVEDNIVMQTMGARGLNWTPYLTSLLFFIFFCNIFEIIPFVQMPATARIALPLFLAVLTYLLYNGAGIKEHGPLRYFKVMLFPPGVPWPLYVLVAPIEFISRFLVQPFSHTVRLFANLLAGHILLVTFAVLSAALFTSDWVAVFLPLPAFAMVFFVGFEILVSILQAYVFTLLAGVYLNQATSHEH